MKKFLILFAIFSGCVFADAPKDLHAIDDVSVADAGCEWEAVYCDAYSTSTASGYSLYRARDRKDLGNAIWTGDSSECGAAAQYANTLQNGLVCAKYHNKSNSTTAYSLYRISDGRDLGKATISDFGTCEAAMASLRNGIFCSTYVVNGETKWSMYDVYSGNDLGTTAYGTLEACEAAY